MHMPQIGSRPPSIFPWALYWRQVFNLLISLASLGLVGFRFLSYRIFFSLWILQGPGSLSSVGSLPALLSGAQMGDSTVQICLPSVFVDLQSFRANQLKKTKNQFLMELLAKFLPESPSFLFLERKALLFMRKPARPRLHIHWCSDEQEVELCKTTEAHLEIFCSFCILNFFGLMVSGSDGI